MRLLLTAFLFAITLHAQQPAAPKPKAYTDPAQTNEDFPIQGEYVGEIDGKTYGVQIWAQGGGKFEAVSHLGGLPGAGWDGDRSTMTRVIGTRAEGAKSASFESPDGSIKAEVNGASILVNNSDGVKIMELNRMNRESTTLGAPAPANAVVLFDGKGVNRFPKSRVDEKAAALMEGITSEDTFGDCSLHVEFFLPYMPEARGQGRGNSGLYLQGRYEVQMLDSFGLEGKDNECGGLYKIAAPKVNMCLPPLTWQTYDVDFTAAKYDAAGKKTANARITVKHNGVVIHDNQELPGATTSAPNKEENTPGPVYLQNHGNPVRYRNIWVLRK
ncbi:DUF1080 domain-containing protein [Prosthecobacter sp.]|uniref:DUF1080 domain-containing protein n=1 Tax=Prosthecobacter sp. TaxID=1965333 RepID=UPI00378391C1